jgi:hypothetical protein
MSNIPIPNMVLLLEPQAKKQKNMTVMPLAIKA